MIQFLQQPGHRALALAILLIIAIWPSASHSTLAHAASTPGVTLFATSFENGEPQPTWTNTVDGGSWYVGGVCCGLTGPEAGVRQEMANSGARALMYSGLDQSPAQSFAYERVFDLDGQGITLDSTSTLSYWIYPQSNATASVPVGERGSTCVAIDMVFTDGGDLRDSGVVDQNGVRLHPAAQCGHLVMDTWNHVVAALGAKLSGKTISHINVGFDAGYNQPTAVGGYRGYIDDISITSAATPSTPTDIPTSGTTGNGCQITPAQAQAEYHLFTLLNQHRAAAGVNPLSLDETLSVASRGHSCDMFQHQNLSHTGSDGSSPFDRMRAVGITFGVAGENIGATWGYGLTDGVDTTDTNMMAEPLTPGNHHWNIVASGYTRVGIGIIYINNQMWLTEDFVG